MTNQDVFAMIDNIRYSMRRFLNSRNRQKRFDKHSYVALEIDKLTEQIRALKEEQPDENEDD